MEEAEFLIVTPEQFKQGWIEMKGVSPVHHAFILIHEQDDRHLVVRNPKWKKL